MKPPLTTGAPKPSGTVSVVIPARDEEARLGPCLEALRGEPVDEVIVVDDQSSDGTAALAASFGSTVVRGEPLPEGWAGKAWALEQGLRAATGDWVVFFDADTRPQPGLVAALIEAAGPVDLVSAGPLFLVDGFGEQLLHPAFLATIVYRFGPPGVSDWQPSKRRATMNGQCVVVRRSQFVEAGGWTLVHDKITEDLALARALRAKGWRIGFEGVGALLEVRMYETAAETWTGWGRSLMAPDVTPLADNLFDLLTLWLVMALPIPRLLLRRGDALDVVLAVVRLALHKGFTAGYRPLGPGFWLSPLADVPVMLRLTQSVLRPTRTWRGRTYD